MRPPQPRSAKAKQRGAALMVMLAIMVMGALTFLVGSLSKPGMQIERGKITAAALAQAKEALIGYAITYGDKNTAYTHGYLPCPDTNNDGSSDTNQGSTYCAGKDIPVIGRLPWKSLGLPPLRDGQSECLWYAVSGTFKAVAGGYMNDVMNWDTLGQFSVQGGDGNTLIGTTAHDRPVAVIFSAGPPLNAQSHPLGTGQECSGDASNDVAAYLEGNNVFTPPEAIPATPIALIAGNSGSTINNDIALWITPGDIFNRIKKRNDFGTFVSTLLSAATACLSSIPNPVTIDFDDMSETTGPPSGLVTVGRIPSPALTSCANNNLVKQWRDNLLYVACTASDCLTVNSDTCSGAVIFTGERTTSQSRTTNADKNNWSNYLEDTPHATYTAFTTESTSIAGASSYSTTATSTDIVACIP